MYMMNKMGPNTDPCGTPLTTSAHDDDDPLTITQRSPSQKGFHLVHHFLTISIRLEFTHKSFVWY